MRNSSTNTQQFSNVTFEGCKVSQPDVEFHLHLCHYSNQQVMAALELDGSSVIFCGESLFRLFFGAES